MSELAFVLGNGESRKGIDIDDLKAKGTVFACNGVYRTHRPHFLIAVDPKMIHEIAETDYMLHNKVWSNFNEQYRKNQKIMDFVQWFKPSLGWSSGPTALRMACEQGFKEIYILGFDYQGHKDGQRFILNNIFGDTRNYKRKKDEATFFGNWMNQTKRVIQDYPHIKFKRVVPKNAFKPHDLEFFKNFKHVHIEDFYEIYNVHIENNQK